MAKEFEFLMKIKASLGSGFKGSFLSAAKNIQGLDSKLKTLNSSAKKIEGLQKTEGTLEKLREKADLQRKAFEKLSNEYKRTGSSNDKLLEKMRKKDAEIAKSLESIKKEEKSLEKLNEELKNAGINTEKLGEEQERLAKKMEKVEKATGKLKKIEEAQARNRAAMSATRREIAKTSALISAGIGGGLVALGKAASSLDRIDKLSQKIGMSRKAFQEWDYILSQSGASIDSMTAGMKTLNNRIEEAVAGKGAGAEAFKAMGVAIRDENGELRRQEDIFADVVVAMQKLPASVEKSALAVNFFGKQGQELMPLLNSSTESIEELRKVAHDMGLVLSDEAVNAGVVYGDTMDSLKKTLGGASMQILSTFMPAVVRLAEKITDITAKISKFAGEHPKLVELIGKVVAGLAAAKLSALALKMVYLDVSGSVLTLRSGLIKLQQSKFADFFSHASQKAGALSKKILRLGGLTGKVSAVFQSLTGTVGGGFKNFAGIAKGHVISLAGSVGGQTVKMVRYIDSKTGGILGKIGNKFVVLGGQIGHFLGPIGGKIGHLLGPIGKLFSGIAGKAALVTLAIGAVVTVFRAITGYADAIREKIRGVFGEGGVAVFDKFLGIINTISNAVKSMFGGDGTKIIGKFFDRLKSGNQIVESLRKVLESLMTVLPKLLEAGTKAAETILPALVKVFGAVIDVISKLAEAVLPALLNLIDILIPVFGTLISNVLPSLASVFSTVVNAVSPIVDGILPVLIGLINTLMPIITAVSAVMIDSLVAAIQQVTPILDGLKTTFQGIIDFLTGVFTGDWGRAWEGVVQVFSGAWQSLSGIVKAPINGVITLVNKAISGLNKIKVPDWVPGIGGAGINIPQIPLLAKGSMHTPDTFIAGEKGPELITGSAGKRVFTSNQTRGIFEKVRMAYETLSAKSLDTTAIESILYKVSEAVGNLANAETQKIDVSNINLPGDSKRDTASIVINSSPVFNVARGGDVEEIAEQFERYKESLIKDIREALKNDATDAWRRSYA